MEQEQLLVFTQPRVPLDAGMMVIQFDEDAFAYEESTAREGKCSSDG